VAFDAASVAVPRTGIAQRCARAIRSVLRQDASSCSLLKRSACQCRACCQQSLLAVTLTPRDTSMPVKAALGERHHHAVVGHGSHVARRMPVACRVL
jgi:hypothetical protein